jgi:hypothetical protein
MTGYFLPALTHLTKIGHSSISIYATGWHLPKYFGAASTNHVGKIALTFRMYRRDVITNSLYITASGLRWNKTELG